MSPESTQGDWGHSTPEERVAALHTIDRLEQEIQKDLDDQELWVQLGEAYIKAGCFRAKTLPVFERVLSSRPRSATFQKALSIAFLVRQIEDLLESASSGRMVTINETIDTLNALAGDFPDSPDLLKTLGDLRLLTSDAAAAVECYQRALDAGFDSIGDIIRAFECVPDKSGMGVGELTYFSRLYRLAGNETQATALLEQAVDAGGGGEAEEALLNAYGIEDLTTEDAAQLSEATLNRVLTIYLNSGREDKVEELIGRLDTFQSASPDLFLRLARRAMDEGELFEAFQRLKRAPMDSRVKDLLNEVSLLLEGQGEFEQAAQVLRYINEHDYVIQEAAEIQEKQLEISAEMELADLHFNNQRYGKAIETLVNVLRLGPAKAEPIVERIDEILDRGERVDGSLLLFLGEYFHKHGEPKRAIDYLNRLLDVDPNHAEAIGRLDVLFVDALRESPDSTELHLSRGVFLLRVGRPEKAIEEYLIASGDPELALAANRRLVEAYLATSEWVMALERFHAVTLGPDDLETLYHLHLKLEEAGAHTEVMQALTLIRDIDPNYRDVQEKLEKYEQSASAPHVAVDPRMRSLIGDLATGRYRYVEKLGSGGMGVVHRVFDTDNNRPVAMKILREGLANSNKALMRFVREAQYADELNHPNIVHVYDFNVSKVPGQSFITMEYVDGPSMREILDERIKDDFVVEVEYLSTILNYCVQLCDALDATHKKGIIHRDIKPDNIMVNSAGMVKITDFGIVHVEEGGPTPTGALLGTPRYMSPEQVKGSKIAATADIYSVGIVLYEMLTSSPPFISGDIAYQQINVRPTMPREIVPMISPSLNQIMMTCLEKEPQRRYQSARSLKACLVEDLRKVGSGTQLGETTADASVLEDMDL